MRMKSLSPVIFVEKIEECVEFWTSVFGFEIVSRVGGEDGRELVFAMLKRDEVTLMYQLKSSLVDDLPQVEPRDAETSVMLYVNVSDLDETLASARHQKKVFEPRKTFYGATEFGIREPAGNLVIFAHLPHD